MLFSLFFSVCLFPCSFLNLFSLLFLDDLFYFVLFFGVAGIREIRDIGQSCDMHLSDLKKKLGENREKMPKKTDLSKEKNLS